MRHRGINMRGIRRKPNVGMQGAHILREQEVERMLGLPGVDDLARERREAARAALQAELLQERQERAARAAIDEEITTRSTP